MRWNPCTTKGQTGYSRIKAALIYLLPTLSELRSIKDKQSRIKRGKRVFMTGDELNLIMKWLIFLTHEGVFPPEPNLTP